MNTKKGGIRIKEVRWSHKLEAGVRNAHVPFTNKTIAGVINLNDTLLHFLKSNQ